MLSEYSIRAKMKTGKHVATIGYVELAKQAKTNRAMETTGMHSWILKDGTWPQISALVLLIFVLPVLVLAIRNARFIAFPRRWGNILKPSAFTVGGTTLCLHWMTISPSRTSMKLSLILHLGSAPLPKAVGIMIEIFSFRLVNVSHSWFESSISEMPGLEIHAIS